MTFRHRIDSSAGFTMIEVIVAMFVLVIGLTATFGALASAHKLTLTDQRQNAGTVIGEQALEQLRAMTYANLALSSLPTHTADGNLGSDTSGNPTNPAYWVSGTNLLIPANFSQESSGTLSGVSASGEAMVSGGTVSPGPSSVSSGGYTGSVYTFISWVNDTCTYNAINLCPSAQDAKRVTVAVVLGTGGAGVQKPVWLSTIVANPKA